jgi:ketosteroid isomerase-like protein
MLWSAHTEIEACKHAISAADGATVVGLMADTVVVSDLGMTANGKVEAIQELQQVFAQNPHCSITFSNTVYVLDTAVERSLSAQTPSARPASIASGRSKRSLSSRARS